MTRSPEQIRRTDLGPRPLPPIAPPGPLNMPPWVDTVLPTGLRVLLVRHPSAPTVRLRLMIPAVGTDPRHVARVAVLAKTLFAGTRRRDRLTTAEDMARVGGNVEATSREARAVAIWPDCQISPEPLIVSGHALSSGLATMLNVVVDALTDAIHGDEEVTRARDMLAQQVVRDRAEAHNRAREALQRHLYGDHPITYEVPEPADIVAVCPEEVRALHRTTVVPNGAVLILVGDLDLDDALAQVEQVTAAWASSTTAQEMPPVPTVAGGTLQVVHQAGAPQSTLRLSAPVVPHTDPQYPALCLATVALGGSFSARFIQIIREQKGYCYSAFAALEITRDTAALNATVNLLMSTATQTTAPALDTLRAELDRLGTQPPDATELDQTRRYAIGARLTEITSQERLANTLSALVNRGLDIHWLAKERDLLDAVTVEQVADVAQRFFAPARFAGVILGDNDVLKDTLSGVEGVRTP